MSCVVDSVSQLQGIARQKQTTPDYFQITFNPLLETTCTLLPTEARALRENCYTEICSY